MGALSGLSGITGLGGLIRTGAISVVTPDSYSGLVLRLKGDSEAFVSAGVDAADGEAASIWGNLGSGADATQATVSKQPTLQTGEINSKPVMRFDGTGDCFVIPSLQLNDFTAFLVVKPSEDGVSLSAINEDVGIRHNPSGSNVFALDIGGAQVRSSLIKGTGTGFHMLTVRRESGVVTLYENGSICGTGSLPGVLTFDRLGTWFGFRNYGGDMAEVLVYDTALTDSQVSNLVFQYFGSEYAFPFPASYPYTSRIVSGGAQWPYNGFSRTGPIQFQMIYPLRVSSRNLKVVWINPTGTPKTFVANVRKGFYGGFKSITQGGSETITLPPLSRVETEIAGGLGGLAGEWLYVRSYFAEAGTIDLGTGKIASFQLNPEGIPISSPAEGSGEMAGWVQGANRMTETGGTFEASFAAVNEQPVWGPYGFVGDTDDPREVVSILGDSKTQWLGVPGVNTAMLAGIAFGEITGRPFQNLAVSGDTVSGFLADSEYAALRRALLEYGGHVVYRYGTNSLDNGSDPAAAAAGELSNIQTIADMWPTARLYVCTVDPEALKTSGDWSTITEAQQTQGGSGLRGVDCPNTFNGILRTSPPAYIDEVVDTAAAVTTPSGYWLAGMTGDGIHQTAAANALQGPIMGAAVNE